MTARAVQLAKIGKTDCRETQNSLENKAKMERQYDSYSHFIARGLTSGAVDS
jgi:hypothetical protein